MTPVYARIGRKLIDSIRNATVVKDPLALTLFAIKPKGLREMITRAMQNEDNEFAVTRWSDALSSTGLERSWGGVRLGNRLVDSRTVEVAVPAEEAFRPIRRIGGATGWYYGNWLWRLRGLLTPWSVGSGCAGAGGIRTPSESGIRWTFGALRQLKKPQASPVCRDEIAGTGLVGVQWNLTERHP